MTDQALIRSPPDICLLLRAHAEQRWLTTEVLPVVRELEPRVTIPEEQLGAALAYLEVLWLDARRRAAETEAAVAALGTTRGGHSTTWCRERARRYHAAVRRLRALDGRPRGGASPAAAAPAPDARVRRSLRRSHTLPAPMAPRFDLQSHSTHSDGTLPAGEVVPRAADAGVELLALSDHDTISGVSEAIAAGERVGVRVVPAVEISAVDDEASRCPRELHILGYNIDHTGPGLTQRLTEFLADREQRTLRMADALKEVGFELDETEIRGADRRGQTDRTSAPGDGGADRARERRPAEGRGHRRRRLADPRIPDRGQARLPPAGDAHRGRGGRGDPRGRRRRDLGAPLLGHLRPRRSARQRSTASSALGIDGVEAFYITHTREQTELLARRCAELGLLDDGLGRLPRPENRQFLTSSWPSTPTASSRTSGRSKPAPRSAPSSRQRRFQPVG